MPLPRPRLVADAAEEAARVRVVERDRLATKIDGDLVAACRAEAAARLSFGELASQLLARHAYRDVAFVSLPDYARERLGLSARTVEDAALVATRLRALPVVAAAYRGGLLSWTKLRALVDVAAGNERAWLEYARVHTAAELDAAIHAGLGPSRRQESDDSSNLIDGEPAGLLRIACPSRLRSLWRYACELASRAAGRPLAAWQAAEIVAAEGIAARPSGVSIGDRMLLALVRLARRRSRPADPPPQRGTSHDAVPAIVHARANSEPPPPVPPLPRMNPTELDRALRAAVQALREAEPRIGRLLRVVVDHRLHRSLDFHSLAEYARNRLGISIEKVWALVRVDRAVRRAAPFADAYFEGRISWVRTLALLPVVDRTTVDAGLARAAAVTVRRLYDEVNWVRDRRDVAGDDASLLPPPLHARLVQIGAPHPAVAAVTKSGTAASRDEIMDAEIRFRGPATVVALFRDATDAFAEAGEARWRAVERLLLRVIRDWEAEPGHRDPVFARDGWRCTVPACGRRRNLHDHHVRFRSRGGGNERWNRTTVCAAHHLHGIHTGLIRATGEAPRIRWDLPLFSCIGDAYV
jgi:hypothetical protein